MRIRPVTPKDAESIDNINAKLTKERFSSFFDGNQKNAEQLIAELTQFDHMLVLETETEPQELCAAAGETRFEEAFIKLAGEGVQ